MNDYPSRGQDGGNETTTIETAHAPPPPPPPPLTNQTNSLSRVYTTQISDVYIPDKARTLPTRKAPLAPPAMTTTASSVSLTKSPPPFNKTPPPISPIDVDDLYDTWDTSKLKPPPELEDIYDEYDPAHPPNANSITGLLDNDDEYIMVGDDAVLKRQSDPDTDTDYIRMKSVSVFTKTEHDYV